MDGIYEWGQWRSFIPTHRHHVTGVWNWWWWLMMSVVLCGWFWVKPGGQFQVRLTRLFQALEMFVFKVFYGCICGGCCNGFTVLDEAVFWHSAVVPDSSLGMSFRPLVSVVYTMPFQITPFTHWLILQLADWLFSGLTDFLIWFTDWLLYLLIKWCIDLLIYWFKLLIVFILLTNWYGDQLAYWLTGLLQLIYLFDLLVDWFYRLPHWLTGFYLFYLLLADWINWCIDGQVNWFIGWLIDWLMWLVDFANCLIINCL